MDKTIHEIFPPGGVVKLNDRQFIENAIMIIGTSETLVSVLSLSDENGKSIICGVDIEKKSALQLNIELINLYEQLLRLHEKRLLKNEPVNEFNLKSDYIKDGFDPLFQQALTRSDTKHILSKMIVNNNTCEIVGFSLLCNKQGDGLLVSVSETEMIDHLSKEPLYNEAELVVSFLEFNLKYTGTIVRIEKNEASYYLFIHPYSTEIMQSTQIRNASFGNIINPFSVLDFIVNYADIDVKGINYPGSDQKPIHNYIIVGAIKNLAVEIENCVVGNVRIGNCIDASERFHKLISDSSDEQSTIIWVNIKADSFYQALLLGKEQLVGATEFISFLIKNDMFADWFGAVECNNCFWDVQSHYPKISLSPVFYIENCFLGESITLSEESIRKPSAITLDENASYLFEYDWINCLFNKLQTSNKKILRLQFALKWVVQAWNVEDLYDKVLYSSMALEFIVNGEKGQTVFDEYASAAGRTSLTKADRNKMINDIIKQVDIGTIDGLSEDMCLNMKERIQRMIQNKLKEVSFNSKLDILISRLDIPVSPEEKELLKKIRKTRNNLIHGADLDRVSTLEMKKHCGLTSRILIYKILDEIKKE